MTKIVWSGYIEEQKRWAERLDVLAKEADPTTAQRFKNEARRALQTVQDAIMAQQTICKA